MLNTMLRIFLYIDPGSGSLILQATLGVILGLGVFFRNSLKHAFQSIKQVFRGNKKNKTE